MTHLSRFPNLVSRRVAIACATCLLTAPCLVALAEEPAKPAATATPQAADEKPAAQPEQAPAGKKVGEEKPAAKPQTAADRIIAHTNAIRSRSNLRPFSTDPRLNAAAQGMANYMAYTGRFSHTADGTSVGQRVAAQRYSWSYVAENIAYQGGMAYASADQTAVAFVNQWMNSPGHRQNILSYQATQMGAATAVSPNGSVYAVQVFGTPAGW